MPDKNVRVLEGRVEEALPGAMFRVSLPGDKTLIAHLSGKMRIHHIKILPGDKVLMELSPYGDTRGRIIRRL